MIVLDASAVIEIVLGSAPQKLLARIAPADVGLHAPYLLDIEVAHVLRRLVAAGEVGEQHARAALDDFAQLDLVRHPHDLLLPRIWELRHNLTAYDATYVALAEALDAPLLTRDGRLAKSSGHLARIELV